MRLRTFFVIGAAVAGVLAGLMKARHRAVLGSRTGKKDEGVAGTGETAGRWRAKTGGVAAGSIVKNSEAAGKLQPKFGEKQNRDSVEEASWESFPASDPPAW